jgi:addiction module HigA family antidote
MIVSFKDADTARLAGGWRVKRFVNTLKEVMMMPKLEPVTPGELLREEFLVPMGLSQYRLAKEIGVPAQRISEIVAGRRAITADTDLRLCRFFGLSNGYWLRAQAAYDTEVAEDALSDTLQKIKPWSGGAKSSGALPSNATVSSAKANEAVVRQDMVEAGGIEPPSETRLERASTSVSPTTFSRLAPP